MGKLIDTAHPALVEMATEGAFAILGSVNDEYPDLCPHCGKEDFALIVGKDGSQCVMCLVCQASGPVICEESPWKSPIHAWNLRLGAIKARDVQLQGFRHRRNTKGPQRGIEQWTQY